MKLLVTDDMTLCKNTPKLTHTNTQVVNEYSKAAGYRRKVNIQK